MTVAVLPEPTPAELFIDPKDLDERFTRGSGAGGQHRNKTASAVVLTHKPTGITVRIEDNRSQHRNRTEALNILRAKLLDAKSQQQTQQQDAKRRNQVGTGMRGDKIRTIAIQRDQVIDHATKRRTSFKKYSRGDFSWLV